MPTENRPIAANGGSSTVPSLASRLRRGRQPAPASARRGAWTRITGTRWKKCAGSNRARWSRSFSGNVPLRCFAALTARSTRWKTAAPIASSNLPWARWKAAGWYALITAGNTMRTGVAWRPRINRFGQSLPNLALKTYPVQVRYGLVWVFPGEPELAQQTPHPGHPRA